MTLERFSNVVEPPPYDPYCGLTHLHERIWSYVKYPVALLTFLRILLNCYSVTKDFYLALTLSSFVFGAHAYEDDLENKGLRFCATNTTADDRTCLHTDLHRFVSYKLIHTIGFFVVIPLAIVVAWIYASYLCSSSEAERGRKARNQYWVLIFGPRFVASFSTLFFLGFYNVDRFFATLWHGEGRLLMRMVTESTPLRNNKWLKFQLQRVGKQRGGNICTMISLGVYLCFLWLAFQTLLVKLTTVYFAAVTGYVVWDLSEWINFLAFVNQLGGVMHPSAIEMRRLILCRYSGASGNANPSDDQIQVMSDFLSLIAWKITSGNIFIKHGRFGSAATLCTLSSYDVQKTFHCEQREQRTSNFRRKRCEVLEAISVGEDAESYHDAKSYQGCLAKHGKGKLVDTLAIKRERIASLEKTRNELIGPLSTEVEPASSRLYLAADLQNLIEDVNELEISDTDEEEFFCGGLCNRLCAGLTNQDIA